MPVRQVAMPKRLQETIREVARREHESEAAAIRRLLRMGGQSQAVQLYREGHITLNQAARMSGLPLREMLEVLWSQGVSGNVTAEQTREGIETIRRALDREKRG